MKRPLLFVFLVFLLRYRVTYATKWPTQRYSELNLYLHGLTIESSTVNTIFECYRKCEENIHCASINMNMTSNTCELKSSTKTRHPEKTVTKQNTIYMEIRDHFTPGLDPDNPIVSCKHLKQNHYHAKSGVYWMKFNEPSSAPFKVFCDMTTDGGGWTLVWSYSFALFNNFNSYTNRIYPLPSWPLDWSTNDWSPRSTVTPLSESSRSAMDFTLWKKIGNEFLLTPNVSNWVACEEGTGSLVEWRTGTITCRVVKAVTPICTKIAPDSLYIMPWCGPSLKNNGGFQFILDGSTNSCFPTHDPCGADSVTNHLQNVANPGGSLYIR